MLDEPRKGFLNALHSDVTVEGQATEPAGRGCSKQ